MLNIYFDTADSAPFVQSTTKALIEQAAKTGAVIACENLEKMIEVEDLAKSMGLHIHRPIPFSQAIGRKLFKNILINDIQAFLAWITFNLNTIDGFSYLAQRKQAEYYPGHSQMFDVSLLHHAHSLNEKLIKE